MALTYLNNKISELCHVNHTILTSSGSAALITALKASNIPLNSEVIIPSICCPAVLFAIQWSGYIPVLSDINLDNYSLGVSEVEEQLTSQTKAILAVHNYGHYCQIDKLIELCRKYNLLLIEDACLAMGGTYKNKPLGSYGDISIVSFGYDKIIDCHYGGALLTNNNQYFESAQNFINTNPFFAFNEGLNHQSIILNKLNNIEHSIKKRQENSELCDRLLKSEQCIKLPFKEDILYWRYPVLVKKNRDSLIKFALKSDIILPTHYKSLHQFSTGLFRERAQYVSEHIINIFIRPDTPKEQIIKTINLINEFYV